MLFNSHIFLFVFLPVVLAGFYLLARGLGSRYAKGWLVGASLVYYGWWNPVYLWLILGSGIFNFWMGKGLIRQPRKWVLALGVIANLALLGYYKYANFFVDNLNAAFGMEWTLKAIILPLAISFFTFQQIAYLIDTYRGDCKDYTFLDYILFVTFFPQLIAGPIVHHKEMMPQFEDEKTYRFQWESLAIGVTYFTMGLFKKVMIADHLSGKAIKVFGAADGGQLISVMSGWGGALAYAFQIYFDFSGYSDMAIGIGFMFGIMLPLNFNSPYKAFSIVDFWRRWHITLSRFLRDYLYIPLGGNRKGSTRRYVNLMFTMVLGGLWHGAGWTFAIWGALHGLFLCVNHGFSKMSKAVGMSLPRWIGVGITFLAVVVAWVFFRAESVTGALHLLAAMFGLGEALPEGASELIKTKFFYNLGFVLLMVWLLPNTQEVFRSVRARPEIDGGWKHAEWGPRKRWAVVTAIMLVTCILSLSQVSEFLYYQF